MPLNYDASKSKEPAIPQRGSAVPIPILFVALVIILVGIWFVYKNTSTTRVIDQTGQTVQKTILSKEDLLKQRVSDYFKSFQYYDYDKIYEFLTPEDKNLITKEDFVVIRKKADAEDKSLYKFSEAKIDSVELTGDSAIVRLTEISCLAGNCNLPDEKGGVVKREDKLSLKWLYIDNQWYRPMVSEGKEFYGIK